LEKKYDKSEAEKEALLYRNRNILTTTVAVFLMILLITLLIIWSQRHKQLHLKQLVNEQEKMALEKNNQLLKERQQRSQLEKQITDQQIMEQQFLLPLYEQITTRNTQIRKFLYDLTTDTHINKMPFLHEKIKNEFKLFDETVHSKNFESLTDDDFSKVTHLVEKRITVTQQKRKIAIITIGDESTTSANQCFVEHYPRKSVEQEAEIEEKNGTKRYQNGLNA